MAFFHWESCSFPRYRVEARGWFLQSNQWLSCVKPRLQVEKDCLYLWFFPVLPNVSLFFGRVGDWEPGNSLDVKAVGETTLSFRRFDLCPLTPCPMPLPTSAKFLRRRQQYVWRRNRSLSETLFPKDCETAGDLNLPYRSWKHSK